MRRLYADENFSRLVVEELRRLGYDVLTSQEASMSHRGVSDEIVLAFATANDRAVLTLNRRHFFRLHRSTPDHPGIIACTRDDDAPALAGRIDRAILGSSSLAGCLIRVNRD